MRSIQTFKKGIELSLQYWQAMAALWVANILIAGLVGLLPALALYDLAQRPMITQAAERVEAGMVLETFLAPISLGQLNGVQSDIENTGVRGVLSLLIILTALPFLTWLSGAFLHGGMLLAYIEAPQPFRWRRFWWGCWHWFGAFLLLGFIQVLAAALALLPLAIISSIGAAALGQWVGWLGIIFLAVLGIFLIGLVEATRIFAVAGDTRNLVNSSARAFRFISGRLFAWGFFYLLALVTLATWHTLFRLAIQPQLPLEVWLITLAIYQLFIIGRLWSRAIRNAGVIELARQDHTFTLITKGE